MSLILVIDIGTTKIKAGLVNEKGKVLFTTLVFRILSIIPSVILALFSQKISST